MVMRWKVSQYWILHTDTGGPIISMVSCILYREGDISSRNMSTLMVSRMSGKLLGPVL